MFGCSVNFGEKPDDSDVIVARVNDEVLRLSELIDRFPHLSDATDVVRSGYVQKWIEERILLNHIRETRFDQRDDVKGELEKIKEAFLLAKFSDHMYVGNTTKIEPEDIVNFYNENREDYKIGETKYRYEVVFFRNRVAANSGYESFRRNNSLATSPELASEVVKNESTNSFVKESQISPVFLNVLAAMKIGEISKPFPVDKMYAVVRLSDKRNEGDYLQIEDVRDFIALKIINDRQNKALSNILDELSVSYRVENIYSGAQK